MLGLPKGEVKRLQSSVVAHNRPLQATTALMILQQGESAKTLGEAGRGNVL
jgi:hypothetical protein